MMIIQGLVKKIDGLHKAELTIKNQMTSLQDQLNDPNVRRTLFVLT